LPTVAGGDQKILTCPVRGVQVQPRKTQINRRFAPETLAFDGLEVKSRFQRVKRAKNARKASFSVVAGETSDFSPPRPLGPQLWDRVQSEYRISDCGGIELLAQACAALDRAEGLAAVIAADGNVIHTRTGVPKTHPGIKDELACRAFVVRTLERLGVNVESVTPSAGRPPRPHGWTPHVT
jgi:hypothetical protein